LSELFCVAVLCTEAVHSHQHTVILYVSSSVAIAVINSEQCDWAAVQYYWSSFAVSISSWSRSGWLS